MTFHSFLMDEKDLRILQALQKDAKAATSQLAKQTGIPPTTIHNRIKRMEAEGIIQGYRPVLDWEQVGLGLHAMIFITAQSADSGIDQDDLAKATAKLPGVQRVRIVTGTHDLILDVRLANVRALDKLLIKALRTMPGIAKTETLIVLDEHESEPGLATAVR